MVDDEIIKALRFCDSRKGHRCSECPVFGQAHCKRSVDKAAADRLEALRIENERLKSLLVERDLELGRVKRWYAGLCEGKSCG